MSAGDAAKDISYASGAGSRASSLLIRSIENLTGRPKLIRMAAGYEREVSNGRDFWEVMQERYGLTFDIEQSALDRIPPDGPLILVANHPFGILDGLAMGRILSMTRQGEFRIVAHQVFRRAEELNRIILPISFTETKSAARLNLNTRKEALGYLAEGGAVGIFPGGAVSTSSRWFNAAMDPEWKTFTARLIAKSGAQVVPVFFEGQNSRIFQIVSRVSQTLRLALLIREFGSRVGEPVSITVGEPIDPAEIAARASDAKGLMHYLRECTYRLSPRPLHDLSYGYGFE